MRNNIALTIYDSALKKESIIKLHKKLYDMTINSKPLQVFSMKVANRAIKIANSYKEEKDVADALFLWLWKSKFFDKSNKLINTQLRDLESKNKTEYLDGLLDSPSIFYIASSHGDSATDHEPYQGKIYADANWRSKTDRKDVADYIKNNNIRTVQWVVGSPVYFITRPNCRHYFVRASANNILSGNYIIPYHTVGPREMQTKKVFVLKYYEQRLRMLKVLAKRYKTDTLTNKITKTDIIIKKYKKVF